MQGCGPKIQNCKKIEQILFMYFVIFLTLALVFLSLTPPSKLQFFKNKINYLREIYFSFLFLTVNNEAKVIENLDIDFFYSF